MSLNALCFIISFALLCSLGACLEPIPDGRALTLFKFTEKEAEQISAKCLDGSPYGFYYSLGSRENATKWIIWLGFGGFCFNEASCSHRLGTVMGSSNYFHHKINAGEGMLSGNRTNNADFHDWSIAFLPYCTGDFHTGTRTSAYPRTNLHFCGHHNLRAAISALQHRVMPQEQQPTDVIVAGGSTGGYAVYLNSDWIAQKFPNSRVSAYAQSGFFIWHKAFAEWYPSFRATQKQKTLQNKDHRNKNEKENEKVGAARAALRGHGDHHEKRKVLFQRAAVGSASIHSAPTCQGNFTRGVELLSVFKMYQPYVHQTCAEHLEDVGMTHLCWQPAHVLKYIRTPLFVAQNLYDADQVFIEGGAPFEQFPYTSQSLDAYVRYFSACLRELLSPLFFAAPSAAADHSQPKLSTAVEVSSGVHSARAVKKSGGKRDHKNSGKSGHSAFKDTLENRRSGAFLPACLSHTIWSTGNPPVIIGDQGLLDTFSNWYYNRTGPAVAMDSCDRPQCNPTCPPPYSPKSGQEDFHHSKINKRDEQDMAGMSLQEISELFEREDLL